MDILSSLGRSNLVPRVSIEAILKNGGDDAFDDNLNDVMVDRALDVTRPAFEQLAQFIEPPAKKQQQPEDEIEQVAAGEVAVEEQPTDAADLNAEASEEIPEKKIEDVVAVVQAAPDPVGMADEFGFFNDDKTFVPIQIPISKKRRIPIVVNNASISATETLSSAGPPSAPQHPAFYFPPLPPLSVGDMTQQPNSASTSPPKNTMPSPTPASYSPHTQNTDPLIFIDRPADVNPFDELMMNMAIRVAKPTITPLKAIAVKLLQELLYKLFCEHSGRSMGVSYTTAIVVSLTSVDSLPDDSLQFLASSPNGDSEEQLSLKKKVLWALSIGTVGRFVINKNKKTSSSSSLQPSVTRDPTTFSRLDSPYLRPTTTSPPETNTASDRSLVRPAKQARLK